MVGRNFRGLSIVGTGAGGMGPQDGDRHVGQKAMFLSAFQSIPKTSLPDTKYLRVLADFGL